MSEYSDYIVYVDESGDHSLTSIDNDYPVFVLTFCIFKKDVYINDIIPEFQKFKLKHFGHDIVILHENEIRRRKNQFRILHNRELYNQFMEELSDIIGNSDFKVISTVIDKKLLNTRYLEAENPYHIALRFCLERLYKFLDKHNQVNKKTHVIVERRGNKEDNELELEFRRVCDGANWFSQVLPFDIILADKKTNSIGMQLSDMIARPIGKHIINPQQENRAFDIIENKFDCNQNGNYNGIGLKKFP